LPFIKAEKFQARQTGSQVHNLSHGSHAVLQEDSIQDLTQRRQGAKAQRESGVHLVSCFACFAVNSAPWRLCVFALKLLVLGYWIWRPDCPLTFR
jgi:hypothetical protein